MKSKHSLFCILMLLLMTFLLISCGNQAAEPTSSISQTTPAPTPSQPTSTPQPQQSTPSSTSTTQPEQTPPPSTSTTQPTQPPSSTSTTQPVQSTPSSTSTTQPEQTPPPSTSTTQPTQPTPPSQPVHVCTYDQQRLLEKYQKTNATCKQAAVYYYACLCGNTGAETFSYGNPTAHSYDQAIANEASLKSSASCKNRAEYYYSCVCGAHGTQTFLVGELHSHRLTYHPQTQTTIEYWSCAACQGMFANAAASYEITSIEKTTPTQESYLYKTETTLKLLHTGDRTRRVQGGIAYGDYFWYAQPGNPESEHTKVVKYNLVTNTVEKEVTNHSYGHAGDMCYNPNNNTIVIKDQSGYLTTTFYVLDADTLDFISSKTITGYVVGAITYDEQNNRYICENQNPRVYHGYYFMLMDEDFNLYGETYDVVLISEKLGWQGICSDDKFLYCAYSYYEPTPHGLVFYNSILVYDKQFRYVGCHSIESQKEIECLGITNGKLYAMFDNEIGLYEIEREYEWEL